MAISTAFDPLFRRLGGKIPVPFLRALSKRESNQNPAEAGGSYYGLLQVGIRNVLSSYNDRRGTRYSADDLLNPQINIAVGSDLLNRIVIALGKHPDRNLKANWANPEFVKLMLASWNSGYSEAAGVGRVARYLEERKIPVTHDAVFQYAGAAGATRHLSNIKKRDWQRSVAALYFAQPDRPRGAIALLAVAAVLFVGWGVYRLATR